MARGRKMKVIASIINAATTCMAYPEKADICPNRTERSAAAGRSPMRYAPIQ